MTNHYYDHKIATIHYYKFGEGPKTMLCFHGFGMHGKQFQILEKDFGNQYTFYGFDLLFHKETKLKDNSLTNIKIGLSKKELSQLFLDFCCQLGIDRFSIMSYSMGTHYGSAIIETFPEKVEAAVFAAPSCLRPGHIVTFFSSNWIGNKIIEQLTKKGDGLLKFVRLLQKLKCIDQNASTILQKEIATHELRFNLYASLTFLKSLKLDEVQFVNQLNKHQIKSLFVFGDKDFNYPIDISTKYKSKLQHAHFMSLPANHDIINEQFSAHLKMHFV